MKNKTIIGLSGLAGSGKDLFYEVLCDKRPEFKRKSLADKLKLDLRQRILDEEGVDVLDCSREDKDKVRPKLVAYAKGKRESTNGRYWINQLYPEVNAEESSVCITDIRYDDYNHDEAYWLMKELDGVLVHIERYNTARDSERFIEAPNEEERRNDPRLRYKAMYNIQWPSFEGDHQRVKHQAGGFVDEFLVWLDGYNEKIKGQSASMESEG